MRANERLAAYHDIDQHRLRDVQGALKQEIKRRQRGKRLNLCGEGEFGPQLYSPSRVQAAIQYQASNQMEEEQRKQGIIDRKALAAARKVQKEKARAERAVLTAEKRKAAAEAMAIKEVEKRARAAAKEEALRQKKVQAGLWAQSREFEKARKIPKEQVRRSIPVVTEEENEVVQATSRGRQVQKPQRFRK